MHFVQLRLVSVEFWLCYPIAPSHQTLPYLWHLGLPKSHCCAPCSTLYQCDGILEVFGNMEYGRCMEGVAMRGVAIGGVVVSEHPRNLCMQKKGHVLFGRPARSLFFCFSVACNTPQDIFLGAPLWLNVAYYLKLRADIFYLIGESLIFYGTKNCFFNYYVRGTYMPP